MSDFKFSEKEREDIRIDMNSMVLTDGEIIDRIESIIQERDVSTPSVPDQRKSREDANSILYPLHLHPDPHDELIMYVRYADALQAMTTYRDQDVSAAVEAKDKEIELRRVQIDELIELSLSERKLQSQLSAANQTIAEKDREIERLKEFEWMYNDLNK